MSIRYWGTSVPPGTMNGSSQDPGRTPESGFAPANSNGDGAVGPSFTPAFAFASCWPAGGPRPVCGCAAEPVTNGTATALVDWC